MSTFQGTLLRTSTIGMLMFATACGGGDGAANSSAEQEAASSAAPATQVVPAQQPQNASVAPEPGGQVIEVRMLMEGTRGVFEPAKFSAKAGDVIRFVNVDNVHNVHFPKANNPAGVTLPPPSPYLTQPGQLYEMKVELPAGTYDYQCDPHAAMGMVGQMTVTQ
jgi:plastocyanin